MSEITNEVTTEDGAEVKESRHFIERFIDKDLEQMANERPNDTLGYVTQMVAQKFGFEQKQIVKELRRYGIYSLLTSPEKLNSDVINRYLEFKSRHIL